MASQWNLFVKKIYKEGKAKNPEYQFRQALVDASKRKSEMSSVSSSKSNNKSSKKRRTMSISGGKRKRKGKTQKRR